MLTVKDVAERIGITPEELWRFLRRVGRALGTWVPYQRRRFTEEQAEQLRLAYNQRRS